METVIEKEVQVGGMGAVPHNEGVAFRVWAPHATEVYVVGDFNEWNNGATPLIHEENGYWSVNVPEAQVGQQYKYLLKTPSGDLMRNDPYARELTNSVGNSIIHDPTYDWGEAEAGFMMPTWNEMVIYELHVGTFNVKQEGKPGDFYGVIERLSYLKALGVNTIEVMPPMEFPGGYSWGYNPAHPFAIESEYGGVKGFKDLVKAAHAKGIAVILDVVYNHFGPGDLDIWQFDGWHENDKGGIYFYNDWRSTTPWGDTRPDYGRAEVRQYIRDNAIMWLDEYHVDGLRMDMVPYIRNVHADGNPANDLNDGYTLIQSINHEIREKYPWKFTVAEDLHSLKSITAPLEAGGLGYSSQWDAEFVHPIRETIITMNDADRDMNVVAGAIMHRYNGDVFERVIYTESHDEVSNGKARVAQEIAGGESDVNDYFAKKRSTLGGALVLTSPGVPMLFQGQTIMEDRWFDDGDPIDWSRLSEFKGIAKLYRDLIKLRTNVEGNTRGLTGQHTEMLHVNNETKVIAFHRWQDGGAKDSTVVVMNFSNQTLGMYNVGLPSAGDWKVRFNSDWEGYSTDFNNQQVFDMQGQDQAQDGQPFSGTIGLGPYSTVIISLD